MKPRLLRTCLRPLRKSVRRSVHRLHKPWRPQPLCWRKIARSSAPSGSASRTQSWHAAPGQTNIHLHFDLPAEHTIPLLAANADTRAGRQQLHHADVHKSSAGNPARLVHPHSPLNRSQLRHALSHTRHHSLSHITTVTALHRNTIRTSLVTRTASTRDQAKVAAGAVSPDPAQRAALLRLARLTRRAVPSPGWPSGAQHQPGKAAQFASEFVWRQAYPRPPVFSQRVPDPAGVSPQPVSAAGTADARGIQAQAVAIAQRQVNEAVRSNLLDGPTADRLAEDVLRRVEKRLRIERERRGG